MESHIVEVPSAAGRQGHGITGKQLCSFPEPPDSPHASQHTLTRQAPRGNMRPARTRRRRPVREKEQDPSLRLAEVRSPESGDGAAGAGSPRAPGAAGVRAVQLGTHMITKQRLNCATYK